MRIPPATGLRSGPTAPASQRQRDGAASPPGSRGAARRARSPARRAGWRPLRAAARGRRRSPARSSSSVRRDDARPARGQARGRRPETRNPAATSDADQPLHRDRQLGRGHRGLLRADEGERRRQDGPRERDADLDAEQPGDRQAADHRFPSGAGAAAAEPAQAQRQHDDHDADPDRALDPELLREELDEPVRARVEQVGPGRERTPRGTARRRRRRTGRRSHPADHGARRRPRCRSARAGATAAGGPRRRGRRGTPRRARTPPTAAATKNPANTPRTSRMCARSRSLRTGTPSRVTSKSGGPTTRSARTESVTVRSWSGVKPVQAADWARPCSNPTHTGLEERQDRQRHDDERRGEAGDEGGQDAASRVHQDPMVAGACRRSRPGPRPVRRAMPLRASGPAPTTSRP